MINKRINLLTSREDFVKFNRFFQTLKRIVFIFGIIFILVLGSFLVLDQQQNSQILTLQQQEQTLLSQINSHRDTEAQLIFVAKKVNYLNTFSLDDARFLPYYNLLTSALKIGSASASTSSGSATLESFAISKDRVVNFTLGFNSTDEMINSFQLVEDQSFLKNFEKLALGGLSVSANTLSQTTNNSSVGNSLSFNGKFIQLK